MTASKKTGDIPAENAHIILVSPPVSILRHSSASSLSCSKCDQTFRTYGDCKAHELVQHSLTSVHCCFQDQTAGGAGTERPDAYKTCAGAALDVRYFCPISSCSFAVTPTNSSTTRSSRRLKKFFAEFRYLKEHYLRIHSDDVARCSKCNQKLRSRSELMQHLPHCQPETCACGKLLLTRSGFLSHRKKCPEALDERLADIATKKMRINGNVSVLSNDRTILPCCRPPGPPLLPKVTTTDVPPPPRPSSVLSINSCVQTTESSLSRPHRTVSSRSAQCQGAVTPRRPLSAQTSAAVRSSAAQTVRVYKQQESLQIDAFTQTELLDDNEGLSAQDASDILLFLQSTPILPPFLSAHTQTEEAEMPPFLLPSTSSETQTFSCGADDLFITLMDEATPSESGELLMDEFMQASVDMQTQTLEGLGNLFWDGNDAHTQTYCTGYEFAFA